MKSTYFRFAERFIRSGLGSFLALYGVVLGATLSADQATVVDRTRGAERVVVATVRSIEPSWVRSEFGDRLIVSRVQLQVEETLKGAAQPTVWMEVDGGTLDGFTLRVSSLPLMERGERAVFFLEPGVESVYRPYLRGQGILLLDDRDFVRGSSLRLDQIRTTVRSGK
jgi:hypothetical protein